MLPELADTAYRPEWRDFLRLLRPREHFVLCIRDISIAEFVLRYIEETDGLSRSDNIEGKFTSHTSSGSSH